MGTRWRGLLAPINEPTGDKRRLTNITSRPLPLPHRWQPEDADGHDQAVIVGLLDTTANLTVADAIAQGWISAERAAKAGLKPDMMGDWGMGEWFDDADPQKTPRLAENVATAMLLAEKGVIGPSVDAGEAEIYGVVHAGTRDRVTDEEIAEAEQTGQTLDVETLFDHYQVAGVTMVATPAFAETSLPFETLTADQIALTAAVSGSTDLPIADRETTWDGDAAAGRVFDAYSNAGGEVDKVRAGRAFLWVGGTGTQRGDYKLGYADLIDGQLRIVPRGVAATAGGRGVDAADIPAADKTRIKSRICSLYTAIQDDIPDWPDCPFDRTPAQVEARAALVAAAAAPPAPVIPASVFDPPKSFGPITVEHRDGEDFTRIGGYAAQWGVCHTGILAASRGHVCTKAPESPSGYAFFHRYPVDTDKGITAAGRITTGYGRVGTGCTEPECRGKEDHACDGLSLAKAIDHYDQLKTLAWVRAGEDEHGIWFAGITAGELNADDRRVLSRRMVSGDWRPVAGKWEMAEILALAKEKPGFPLRLRNGRQHALLAAGGIDPAAFDRRALVSATPSVDPGRLAEDVADRVIARLRESGALPAAVVAAGEPPTGAMVALVPTEDDARRLAVEGGEPPDQLHLTLLYLGDAASIPPEVRQTIVAGLQSLVEDSVRPDYDLPVEGDGFSVNLFNPGDASDRDTCVVLGVGGADLEHIRSLVEDQVGEAYPLPEQHAPWVPHVSLIYSNDAAMVGQLTDRVGPVAFDRLRVAFADEVTDIPLTPPGMMPEDDVPAEAASRLVAEIDAMFAADRAREAALLLAELEATGV